MTSLVAAFIQRASASLVAVALAFTAQCAPRVTNAPDVCLACDAGRADVDNRVAWPNAMSTATSDPWIIANHDRIEVMRPRIMAINYANNRSNAEMRQLVRNIIGAIREGSRYHGYDAPTERPFIEPEFAYEIDLRDDPPPAGYPYHNSTRYPRQLPRVNEWSVDYGQLFTEEYAHNYGVPDPESPGRYLTLCELSERGLVHELWMYGATDVPDVGGATMLGISPRYSAASERLAEPLDVCAGTACFDPEDVIPGACNRTLRIGFVDSSRGAGCYLENYAGLVERLGLSGRVPYLTEYYVPFAGHDLRARYGLPFDSWLACGEAECVQYPTETSVTYAFGGFSGTVDPYVPVCNSPFFPVNARRPRDVLYPNPVQSTCRGYRQGGGPNGGDVATPTRSSDWTQYLRVVPDCSGPWLVWWFQNLPGLANQSRDSTGAPMHNWWPYLYY